MLPNKCKTRLCTKLQLNRVTTGTSLNPKKKKRKIQTFNVSYLINGSRKLLLKTHPYENNCGFFVRITVTGVLDSAFSKYCIGVLRTNTNNGLPEPVCN